MGRPSKLTDVQWAQIEKRLMSGESASSLAREFGVNRAAVSRRLSQHIATVKTVANLIVEADAAFRSLPVAQQIATTQQVDILKSMSNHLAHAGNYGAAISHRLKAVASEMSDRITSLDVNDEDYPDNIENIKNIAALVRTSNESAHIALELIKSSKNEKSDNSIIQITGGFD